MGKQLPLRSTWWNFTHFAQILSIFYRQPTFLRSPKEETLFFECLCTKMILFLFSEGRHYNLFRAHSALIRCQLEQYLDSFIVPFVTEFQQ